MRLPLLRAGGAAMGQKGHPHSLEAPTIEDRGIHQGSLIKKKGSIKPDDPALYNR